MEKVTWDELKEEGEIRIEGSKESTKDFLESRGLEVEEETGDVKDENGETATAIGTEEDINIHNFGALAAKSRVLISDSVASYSKYSLKKRAQREE